MKLKKMHNHLKIAISSKPKNTIISYYCMNIILNSKLASKRNNLIKDLNKSGVGTSIYYPHPIPRLNYYKKKYGYKKNKFKVSEIFSDRSISLPIGPHLNRYHIDYIVSVLKEIIKNYEKFKK